MADTSTQVPRSFWIISALALAWNLVGMTTYVMQVTMSEEALMALPEARRVIMQDFPVWATSAFAIAVTAGAIGCVLLLLRSAWAVLLFLVSLIGIFVQMYYTFVMADAINLLGPSAAVLPTLIVAVGVALIWYSRDAKEKGWIR